MQISLYTQSDCDIVTEMICSLYQEINQAIPVGSENAAKTIQAFQENKNNHIIWVLKKMDITIGYAIIIKFWSNEFGGETICIDELYILPPYRKQGFASMLLNTIPEIFPDAVALQLEAVHDNRQAIRLYESLGFIRSDGILLSKLIHKK